MTSKSRRWFIKSTIAGAIASMVGCSKPGADSLAIDSQSARLPRITGFKGRIIEKTAPSYEKWRRGMVWQMLKPDRFPAMILRPDDDADVAAAIRFAHSEGLRVSARSGGHHVWGASLRDDAIVIDLSAFKQLAFDQRTGTANVGPSLWASDMMASLAKHDQGFPVAHCATVPLGGYALGGGLGINGDEWGGMACNNIVGGRVVTADGEILAVDERSDTDLLWAMRGAGSGLPGVITEFAVKTFDRPAKVYSSTYVFPLAALDTAMSLLDGIVDLNPRQTELLALMLHNPQAPADAPADLQKAIAVRAQVFVNEADLAAPILDAIAAIPAASQSVFSVPSLEESYEQLFSGSMDWRRGFGFGRFAVENAWCGDRRATIETVAGEYLNAPFWKSHIVIQPKLADAVDGHGAFSVASDTFVGIYSVWDNGNDDAANIDWLRSISRTLDQHAVGHYINEIDAFSDGSRVRRCFSDANWKKLQALRAARDPDGVFFGFPGQTSG